MPSFPVAPRISHQCRVVNASVLLSLIDKSRSEHSSPSSKTAQSLPQSPSSADREASTRPSSSTPPPNPADDDQPEATGKALLDASDHKLKLRFIDAFALICATKSGGSGCGDKENSNTAVCLEKATRGDGGIALRVVRSDTAENGLKSGLEGILKALEKFACGTPTAKLYNETELSIFRSIIQLNYTKVEQGIMESALLISEFIDIAEEFRLQRFPPASDVEEKVLLDPNSERLSQHLTSTLLALRDLQTRLLNYNGEPRLLDSLVNNVYGLRRTPLLRNLQILSRVPELRRAGALANQLSKLGRHRGAARVLMQVCQRSPGMFSKGVTIHVLQTPTVNFEFDEDMRSLEKALKFALPNIDTDELISRLSLLLNLDVPQLENLFQGKREVNYTPHAEAQMISFYDQHPEIVPYGGYIGTSKKSCWLCCVFMECHARIAAPKRKYIGVGGNQQICLGWIIPLLDKHSEETSNLYTQIAEDMCERLEGELKGFICRRVLKPPKTPKVAVDLLHNYTSQTPRSKTKQSDPIATEKQKGETKQQKEEDEWDVVASNGEGGEAEENGNLRDCDGKEESGVTWAMSQSIGALNAVLEVARSTALEVARNTALKVVIPQPEILEVNSMIVEENESKQVAKVGASVRLEENGDDANGENERESGLGNENGGENTTKDTRIATKSRRIEEPEYNNIATETEVNSTSTPQVLPELLSHSAPTEDNIVEQVEGTGLSKSAISLKDSPSDSKSRDEISADKGGTSHGSDLSPNNAPDDEDIRPEHAPLPEDTESNYDELGAALSDDLEQRLPVKTTGAVLDLEFSSRTAPVAADEKRESTEPASPPNQSEAPAELSPCQSDDHSSTSSLRSVENIVPLGAEIQVQSTEAQDIPFPAQPDVDEATIIDFHVKQASAHQAVEVEAEPSQPDAELYPQPQVSAETQLEIEPHPVSITELLPPERGMSASPLDSVLVSNPSPPATASTITEIDPFDPYHQRPITSPSPIHFRRPATSASSRSQVQPSPQPSTSSTATISNTVMHTMIGLRTAASLLAFASSRRRRSTFSSVAVTGISAEVGNSNAIDTGGATMMVPPSLPLPPVMDPISVGDHRHKVSPARKVMLALLVGQTGRSSGEDVKLRRSSSLLLGTALGGANGNSGIMESDTMSLSKAALLGNLQGRSSRSVKSIGNGDRDRERESSEQ